MVAIVSRRLSSAQSFITLKTYGKPSQTRHSQHTIRCKYSLCRPQTMTKMPLNKKSPSDTHFPGDFFSLNKLILPRAAIAYGVQWLGTDLLLNAHTQTFTPVREIGQSAFFLSFESASDAGLAWLSTQPNSPLGIVPLGWDPLFERAVLIHGVQCP